MVRKNEMLEVYKELFCDTKAWDIGMESMFALAKEDPVEFRNLINLFDSTKEGSIDEISHKLGLSDILVALHYEPVKEFFIKIIEKTNVIEDSEIDWSNFRNQVWAAENLIKMNDELGLEFIQENMENMSENQVRSFVFELAEPELFEGPTKLGAKALLILAEKDKRVNYWIDCLKIKEKLTELAA